MALALVLLLGVGLIVFPLADGMPEKTQGVDNVQDTFRQTMSKQGVQTSRDDLVTMEAMLAQLQSETLPQLAQSRGMQTDQLKGLLGLRFPAVGKGLNEVGVIMPRFEETVSVMEQQGSNFREADEIPTADVPNTAVTYLFLVPGVILAVAGGTGLFFSFRGGRSMIPTVALAVAVAMGAVLVIGTLVTDQIGKTKSAEKMFDAFRPTFTDARYQQMRSDMDTLKAFAAEMQNDTIPFLAAQAQQDVPTYKASLATRYPQVGTGLQETPRILGRFDGMIEDIGSNIESFKHADSIPSADTPVSQVPWYLLIPGIGLIAVAGAALLPLGRRDGGAPIGPEAPSGTPTAV
ncbi:hypothetical protein LO772_26135 [Yinghuangia sp. ASG 101]|uniref:hypothetical protein n=1 Tax=Yinghuangia sp. ASG 101 TaxID=2896848 RepID=UPI001E32B882|nr:hypothetical protein [Yinghuangia sp. ASG 101]UGQ10321.1 hypothetical protein LO772_26135 [Yinghuangia sp. ASG 101]